MIRNEIRPDRHSYWPITWHDIDGHFLVIRQRLCCELSKLFLLSLLGLKFDFALRDSLKPTFFRFKLKLFWHGNLSFDGTFWLLVKSVEIRHF
jgi:hypothetical protein